MFGPIHIGKIEITIFEFVRRSIITIVLLLFTYHLTKAQKSDSSEAYRYLNLFKEYEYVDPDKAAIYVDSGFYFADRSGFDDILGLAHQYKGWHYQDMSEYRKAINEFEFALEHFKRSSDKQGTADAYGNLGNGYLDIGNLKQSLDYQVMSLRINDEILASKPKGKVLERASEGRAIAIYNIGALYLSIGLYEKALEYVHLSIQHEKRTNNKVGEAVSYNSLGVIHHELNDIDSAVFYFRKALKIYETNPYDYGRSSTLFRYAMMDKSDLSEEERAAYIRESVALRQALGEKNEEAEVLLEWSVLKFSELSNDSVEAVLNIVDSYLNDFDLDAREELYYLLLSKYKARTGDFNTAYQAVIKYLEQNQFAESRKRANELIAGEINYQWQQKAYQDSIKKTIELKDAEVQKEREVSRLQNFLWIAALGIIVVSFSLYYYIRSNRRKQRMNEVLSEKNDLINEQKQVLEETNRSVAESIRYAEHLQLAILPTPKLVNKYLPDSFLFFLPRDVVSGDFYWFEVKDDYLFLAVADCTGHGVPGALVSVVCSNALNRSLHEFRLTSPADILNKTRELVVETFSKSGKNIDDGMDISLVRYSMGEKQAVFAGANNPLWIIRPNNEVGKCELIEFKGNRMPVGYYPSMKPFTETSIDVEKGDILYQMSDGYVDQFGHENGKRYKSMNLKAKLKEIFDKPVDEQKDILSTVFHEWKGDHPQVDDVTIIGYRI